ncbi:NlpC/P60 family protein [Streptomyces sp. NPDC018610]|uniref:C40 family peptidase n=1 Tax=Streptomyces sp. NPDC018610 TaxID=3365049 RepID=UPI0037B744F1
MTAGPGYGAPLDFGPASEATAAPDPTHARTGGTGPWSSAPPAFGPALEGGATLGGTGDGPVAAGPVAGASSNFGPALDEPPALGRTYDGPVSAGPSSGALPVIGPASDGPTGPGPGPGVAGGTPTGAVARPGQPVSGNAKERSRRKLYQARDLLSRHATPHTPPPDSFRALPPREFRLPAGGEPEAAVAVGGEAAVAAAPGTGYGTKAVQALGFARAQIGKPCVWGAGGPGSYDCSGLTLAAWRVAGVALPRTAHEQAGCGAAVPLAELEPGDLVFFHADAGHVGLYAGNGTMVHAPGPGAAVCEESVFFAGAQAIHSARRPG